ncbi:MAG TPA: hypothetical protein VN924_32655 [Bryobacteraceae bacterium]|jgi:hypothetical protein|nr:hypothetical protein [Bryobacteraceae bacterium]
MRELRALTPEELARAEARLLHPAPGSRIEAAQKFGIDLTLLIGQLRLTPAERVEQMLEACRIAESVRGAGRRRRQ